MAWLVILCKYVDVAATYVRAGYPETAEHRAKKNKEARNSQSRRCEARLDSRETLASSA